VSLKQAATVPRTSHQATSYMIPEKPQIAAPVFLLKDNALQVARFRRLTAISARPRRGPYGQRSLEPFCDENPGR